MTGKRTPKRGVPAEVERESQASAVPVAVIGAEVVRIKLGGAQLGMTPAAINGAIRDGRWKEGKQWHKAPDGTIWVDIPGVQDWVRGV